jgi:hypothetical protein
VLDVGQRAHREVQAVGQIGAVAEAQRDAPTHDVVQMPLLVAALRRHAHPDTDTPKMRHGSSPKFHETRDMLRLHFSHSPGIEWVAR